MQHSETFDILKFGVEMSMSEGKDEKTVLEERVKSAKLNTAGFFFLAEILELRYKM